MNKLSRYLLLLLPVLFVVGVMVWRCADGQPDSDGGAWRRLSANRQNQSIFCGSGTIIEVGEELPQNNIGKKYRQTGGYFYFLPDYCLSNKKTCFPVITLTSRSILLSGMIFRI